MTRKHSGGRPASELHAERSEADSTLIDVRSPEDLGPRAIREIAAGASVRLDETLLDSVAANRKRVLDVLTGRIQPVYGVNTGMGRLVSTTLTAEQQAEHQARLLTARAVGGPPWLPEPDVRALLAVRLRGLLTAETGASPEAARFLAARLDDGFVPAVPRDGIGCAGEIIPLCHAFQTFVGIGIVLEDGREVPAAEALADRGVDPYRPGPKEGMTFLQGVPLATTHAVMRFVDALYTTRMQLVCAAIAVDVLGAPRGLYDPAFAGPDAALAGVLGELRTLTEGSADRELVQAPLSVRVAPQALAHAERVLDELTDAAEHLLAAPTDSPAFLDGEFVSTAVFHGASVGLRMDAVTAALVHLGEISVQRFHRLLDERFSGLPAQLAVDPGPQAGLTPLHKRAVGELHALRRLATPATLGSIDTSAGQEDVQAFACAAGEQLRAAIDHLLAITACELIGGYQAHVLRAAPGAPALRETYRKIGAVVPPVLVDRPLGPDVTRLTTALRAGTL